MITPVKTLQEAGKKLPVMKFALGVLALASVVALIMQFGLTLQTAFIGIAFVVGYMILLIVVQQVSKMTRDLKLVGLTITWFIVIMFMVAGSLFLSCLFFRKPLDLTYLILRSSHAISNVETAEDQKKSQNETNKKTEIDVSSLNDEQLSYHIKNLKRKEELESALKYAMSIKNQKARDEELTSIFTCALNNRFLETAKSSIKAISSDSIQAELSKLFSSIQIRDR